MTWHARYTDREHTRNQKRFHNNWEHSAIWKHLPGYFPQGIMTKSWISCVCSCTANWFGKYFPYSKEPAKSIINSQNSIFSTSVLTGYNYYAFYFSTRCKARQLTQHLYGRLKIIQYIQLYIIYYYYILYTIIHNQKAAIAQLQVTDDWCSKIHANCNYK